MHARRTWLALLVLLLSTGCPQIDDDDPAADDDDLFADDDDVANDDDVADDDHAVDDDDVADDDDAVDDDDSAPVAGGYIYAHGPDTLYEIDPDPPYTATLLGSFSGGNPDSAQITDLGVDVQGQMWAVGFYAVYQVDPVTAALTERHFDAFLPGLNAMTFLADGTLLAGGGNSLYAIDTATGEPTLLQTLGSYIFAGDMVGLPDGLLYLLMCDDGTPTCPVTLVVAMDLDTGDYWEIGPTGVGSLWGVAYHDGNGLIYGFNAAGQTLLLDPVTGQASVGAEGGPEWWGATTNPARWDG